MNSIYKANKQSWTAVTYPQDFSDNGAALGPQTILRLQKIVDTQKAGKFQIGNIILACGIGPDKDEYPEQTKSFAEMMKAWLVAEGTFDESVIHCSKNDKVWNCIEVTMEMIKIIKGHDFSRNVLIVSTGLHVYPRMWITWNILCSSKKGWRLGFVPAWQGTSSLFHELAGTVKYIPMALWYRHKGKV